MLQKLTYLEIEEYVWLILTNFLTYFFFPQMAVKCLNRTKWKFEIRLMVLLLLISKVETRKIIQTILWTGLGKIYFESSSKLIWIAFELNPNWIRIEFESNRNHYFCIFFQEIHCQTERRITNSNPSDITIRTNRSSSGRRDHKHCWRIS